MEGVSTIVPLAVKAASNVAGLSGGRSGDIVEARAQAVERQAQRQAEAEQRQARDAAGKLREESQQKAARARVTAADSGLTLSGSSLLSLNALEHAGDEQSAKVMADSALKVQSLLDSASDQARSIRLSGRTAQSRAGGLGSLLRLGGDSLFGR